jgi:hypothetical protein
MGPVPVGDSPVYGTATAAAPPVARGISRGRHTVATGESEKGWNAPGACSRVTKVEEGHPTLASRGSHQMRFSREAARVGGECERALRQRRGEAIGVGGEGGGGRRRGRRQRGG